MRHVEDRVDLQTNNNITPLSSGGTTPNNKLVDLVAPGYGGEAECNPAGSGCPANTTTEAFGGTSQSAPLIAGAAADVIQAYAATHGGAKPTPAQVKQILTSTAQDIDAPADQQGAGLVDIYAAVRAAQQMPGTTLKAAPGRGSASLVASPTQLDVTAVDGTHHKQDVTLYNTSDRATRVTGSYRTLGRPVQIGRTVVEPVSAPDPSLPVPAQGAPAASPITFFVPPGLGRLDADMIVPDPANGTILSYTLIAPHDSLTQVSYDFGTPSTRAGRNGTTPNIQHVEVAQHGGPRGVGQISTYDISVPAGEKDIDVSFSTPDASSDNNFTYWLVNPSGSVVAEDATPNTTVVGATTPVALAGLIALNPVPGTWEIDVELNLTVSGLEFRQVVTGNVAYNQVQPATESGLPAGPGTTLTAGTAYPASVTVTNTATVGRTFTVRSAAGDITGVTPAYIPSGGTGTITFSVTPTAAAGTAVSGTLTVTSNTSVNNQNETFASFAYAYTAG